MNAWAEILRPINGLMAAIAVLIGFIVTTGEPVVSIALGEAMLSAFLILSAGMVLNDYYDYSIDKKMKKHRPIPSGRIKRRTALMYAFLLFGVGIGIAFMINLESLMIALIAAATLVLYAKTFSKKPFTGNLTVAVNTGLTFVFGAAAAGTMVSVEIISLAGMALFATLAREIYKTIQDMKEDAGVRETIPMKIGVSKSTMIAAFSLVTAIMISPIPYWAGVFGTTYLLLISLVDAGFLYTAYNGMKSKNYAREAKYCKVFQAAALIAFLVGVI